MFSPSCASTPACITTLFWGSRNLQSWLHSVPPDRWGKKFNQKSTHGRSAGIYLQGLKDRYDSDRLIVVGHFSGRGPCGAVWLIPPTQMSATERNKALQLSEAIFEGWGPPPGDRLDDQSSISTRHHLWANYYLYTILCTYPIVYAGEIECKRSTL